MPFQPGNKLGGRKPGALNRSTEAAKLTLARIANQGLDAFKEDIEKIRKENPAKAIDLYIKLLEYVLPKTSRIKMSGEINQKIQQISVNITQKSVDEPRD